MAAGDGLISMTPTSIAYSGTSASINADGGVDFSAVTSLSLNGVFTGDYDNYLLVITGPTSGVTAVSYRFRSAGTDNLTASSYVNQYLGANGTTVSGARSVRDNAVLCTNSDLLNAGFHVAFYGPYLAQPSASRTISTYGSGNARIEDHCNTHNQSTSYDGITIYTYGGVTMTGTVHVFGYEE